MRILILNFILSTAVDGRIIRRESNADTMIHNMARGFVEAGHTVTLAAADDFRPLTPEDGLEFDVKYFPSRLPRIFKPHLLPAPKGFGRWLRRHADDFDMVLSVETFSIPTLIASRICPEKMIIWQEMSYHQRLMHHLPSKFWHNIVVPLFIKDIPTLPQSKAAYSFISQYQPATISRYIPHGVNDKIFNCDSSIDERPIRQYFIVVSMLIKRKRIDRIINKFALFLQNSKHKDYLLKIVGEGPETDNLKKLVANLGIADNVEFLGFLKHEEFAKIGRKATALLVDTDRDLNMVTTSEAFANGTPVLMNSIPNTSIFITTCTLGLVKDNWSWPELQEMVSHYDEFHANCIKHRDKFTNTGVAKAIVEEFNHAHD